MPIFKGNILSRSKWDFQIPKLQSCRQFSNILPEFQTQIASNWSRSDRSNPKLQSYAQANNLGGSKSDFQTLRHCYIVTFAILLHCYIATLLHCYICYIATLLHLLHLLHCYIATMLQCYLAILLHCYITTLLSLELIQIGSVKPKSTPIFNGNILSRSKSDFQTSKLQRYRWFSNTQSEFQTQTASNWSISDRSNPKIQSYAHF